VSKGIFLSKLEQVITEMVHSRSMVNFLYEKKVSNVLDFEWIMQLK